MHNKWRSEAGYDEAKRRFGNSVVVSSFLSVKKRNNFLPLMNVEENVIVPQATSKIDVCCAARMLSVIVFIFT